MKNLKTDGSKIKSYLVEHTTEKFNNKDIDIILLTVVAEKTYKFKVFKDTRHPDLEHTKTTIEDMLKDSKENFSKFDVTKRDRNYLYINNQQYTGSQLI